MQWIPNDENKREHDLQDICCGCCGYMTYHSEHQGCIHAAHPKREWVSLTEEDLSVCDEDGVILARYWEAKLREKNK